MIPYFNVSAREVLTAVRDRDCSGSNRVKAPPPITSVSVNMISRSRAHMVDSDRAATAWVACRFAFIRHGLFPLLELQWPT